MFAVTGGLGIEKHDKDFLDDNDDYSSIMLKSIADRLAEGFAECLHARVRRDVWGYIPDEALSNEEIIAEKYQGIRLAPGYPDRSEARTVGKGWVSTCRSRGAA